MNNLQTRLKINKVLISRTPKIWSIQDRKKITTFTMKIMIFKE